MRWTGIVALFLLAAFFGLLALGNAVALDEAREISARGQATEGVLTEQHRRKKGTAVEYTYTYKVEGREFTAERRSIPWGRSGMPVGSKLAVRYDPTDPERSVTPAELEELEHPANRAFLWIVAFAFLAWAGYLMVRGPKKAT
jgi:hypothetical protein